MSPHVHFDLDAIERQHRAMLDAMFVDAAARADTDSDRAYVALQKQAYEIVIRASVFCAGAENDGHDRARIGKALGNVLGTVQAQFLASNRHNPAACMVFQAFMYRTLDAVLSGDAPDGAVLDRVRVTPMQGGTA